MVALNSVTIAGNLGEDPEIRFTKGGQAVSNFSVASTPRVYNKDKNEWADGETLWMRVTAWGDMAENVAETLRRGNRVLVTGRLEQNNWVTEEGEKRSSIQMVADDVAPSLLFATAVVTRTEAKTKPVPKARTTRTRK